MFDSRVRNLQTSLIAQGFDPGPIDGIWGRRTIAAVKAFQLKHGLEVDGVVGPATAKALGGNSPAVPTPLPWLSEAIHLVGTQEGRGPRNNPVILDWARTLGLDYAGDDIPWCGLFVAHCVGSALASEALPGNPLGARDWGRFGASIAPGLGAIMVFWRVSRDSGKGHVGFYVGENDDEFRILGGNQSDAVSIAWVEKSRFIDARWPSTANALRGVATPVPVDKAQDLASAHTDSPSPLHLADADMV